MLANMAMSDHPNAKATVPPIGEVKLVIDERNGFRFFRRPPQQPKGEVGAKFISLRSFAGITHPWHSPP